MQCQHVLLIRRFGVRTDLHPDRRHDRKGLTYHNIYLHALNQKYFKTKIYLERNTPPPKRSQVKGGTSDPKRLLLVRE